MSDAGKERRQFPRVALGVKMEFAGSDVDKDTKEYLSGIAEDDSLGGVFVATKRPLSVGEVVRIRFHVGEGSARRLIRAKGIVRWRRAWRSPRGMGVEFIDFEGLGREELEAFVNQLVGDDPDRAV